ncbi:MAG: glycosyltransferase family 2 protein [Clostridia bacterium]|nr:glycosyltransferase family 2 protein [Clostridia bacterium]
MTDLTAIILTKNEEQNIEECLKSIEGFAKRAVVVDSGSDDKTVEIASSLDFVDVYSHPFENYARQFNWAIDNTGISTKWTLRLDADERFTPELCSRLEKECSEHENDDVNGFTLEAWLFFMGRKLTHGGGRKRKLMVFKTGIGRIEDRKMDEHTVLSCGESISIEEKFLHYDFKDLNTYVKKLNWYATREMQDYMEDRFPDTEFNASNSKISKKRSKKTKYYKAPMFWRCWAYFCYAYFLKGNCLNGKEGFIYSFLYHLYYRLLVDAKIYEQMKFPKAFENTGDLK